MKLDFDISYISIFEFLEEFNDYNIQLDYCWDNSLDYARYLKEGYTEEEILNDLEIEEEEFDEEYSFNGSFDEFKEFLKEYDCWDDVYLYDITELSIHIPSKTLRIKYTNVSID